MSYERRFMFLMDGEHGFTMTRAAIEAHLLLHGWQPIFYGMGGAAKTLDPATSQVVYLRRGNTKAAVEVHTARILRPRIADGPYPWGHIGNDDLFVQLANRCMEEDVFPF